MVKISDEGKVTLMSRVAVDPLSVEGVVELCDKYDVVIEKAVTIRFKNAQGVQVAGTFDEVLEKLSMKEFES